MFADSLPGNRAEQETSASLPEATSLVAFSLFAGAGGLDLGVESAGFHVIAAVENDLNAIATLNANRQSQFTSLTEVEPVDITVADPRDFMRALGLGAGDVDLLVGGPPCVAFSKSGFHLEYKRLGHDSRAALLDDYLRFLAALRPRAFLMENVYGLAYRNQSAAWFSRLRTGISRLGYSLSWQVLNAADYGAPQNRQRLFLIGASDGLQLSHPTPTHWGEHEKRVRRSGAETLLPHVTARDALDGLKSSPEQEETVGGKYGHLLPAIPPGANYLFYTKHQGHPEPLFEWRSRYWTFLLKLDPNRPAPTIQGQPGPYVGPFHWENRRLRVPELKRLQGFPDSYQFAGSRRAIQLQIGNSVPPPLGHVVANHIRRQLQGELRRPAESRQIDLGLVEAAAI
jgi:DNA (cytosine-5)-methyltransferase 1